MRFVNRIADVTKNQGDETEEVWVRNFPAKRQAKIAKRTRLPAILSSEQTDIPSILLSGAKLTEYTRSVHLSY